MYISPFKAFRRKSPSDLALSGGFSPNPGKGRGVIKGRVDRKGFRQTNMGLGSRTKKDAVTTLVTKRDLLENSFSRRDLEFGPLECPRAILIGSLDPDSDCAPLCSTLD